MGRLVLASVMLVALFCRVSHWQFIEPGFEQAFGIPPKESIFSISLPRGFRMGVEIELQSPAFVGLTRYFDFNRLQSGLGKSFGLPHDFFNDYLINYPQGLSELPEETREKLIEGLQLEDVTLSKDQPVLGSDGKKVEPQAKLILPNSPPKPRPLIIDPNTPQMQQAAAPALEPKPLLLSGDEKPKALVLPKRMAWATLYDRWKALSYKEKKSFVQWENLAPTKKAELAIYFARGEVKVKSNLAPEEKRLFERFHWSLDVASRAMEFRHREDLHVSDPNRFFQDVLGLSRRAGVENKILNPLESRNTAAGLHYHLSVKDKDLRPLAVELNKLFLAYRVNMGNLADLRENPLDIKKEENRAYIYKPNAQGRGLIRLHGKDRFEVKTHVMPLVEELHFILPLLSLDLEDAVMIVANEIRKKMSDYVVDKLGEYKVEYLKDFTSYMSPAQLERVQPRLEARQYVEEARVRYMASRELPKDFMKRAPQLMMSQDPFIFNTAMDLLAVQPTLTEEVWHQFPSLMTSNIGLTRQYVAMVLDHHLEWPEKVWRQLPQMINLYEGSKLHALFQSIAKQKVWPKEFWEQVPEYLTSQDEYLSQFMLGALEDQKDWPQGLLEKVNELKAKMLPVTRRDFEIAHEKYLSSRVGHCMFQHVSRDLNER